MWKLNNTRLNKQWVTEEIKRTILSSLRQKWKHTVPKLGCSCSVVQSCLTLCDPMNGSTPGFPVLHCLPEFAQPRVHWVRMPSSHIILYCPLLLPLSFFPRIRICSNESALCIRWPKFSSFSISPCREYSWLIFRIDWFDLAAHGTLNSLLQHYSWKASVLRHLASFMVQLSHPYVTTGRTAALTRWMFCWQGDVFAF